MTSVFLREGAGQRHAERRRPCDEGGGHGSDAAQAREHPEHRRCTEASRRLSSLWSPRGAWPCPQLSSGFRSPSLLCTFPFLVSPPSYRLPGLLLPRCPRVHRPSAGPPSPPATSAQTERASLFLMSRLVNPVFTLLPEYLQHKSPSFLRPLNGTLPLEKEV